MKILFTDLVKQPGTILTSSFGTNSYPESNLADVFLDRLYVSAFTTDAVSIDFGAEYPVQSIFVAGANATSYTYDLQDASTATVASGTVNILSDVAPVHLAAAVSARYLVIEATAADASYLKIKGIGAGVCHTMPRNLLNSYPATRSGKVTRQKSVNGQVSASAYRPMRRLEWTWKACTFAEMEEFIAAFDALGPGVPTYMDLFEDTESFLKPMYAEIVDEPGIDPSGVAEWQIKITTEEAR